MVLAVLLDGKGASFVSVATYNQLSTLQQSLENAHADCKRLTVLHSETQAELAMLAEKHDQKLMELHSLQLKIQVHR